MAAGLGITLQHRRHTILVKIGECSPNIGMFGGQRGYDSDVIGAVFLPNAEKNVRHH